MYMKKINDVNNIKYIEDNVLHINKINKDVCGDYSLCKRTSSHTTFIICDGIGSGIKAHIAATMCASRIYKSIDLNVSLYTICENITASMHLSRTKNIPYSVFSIVRILNNGQFKILTYEMPLPIIIENTYAFNIKPRYFNMKNEVVSETSGALKNGHSIMLLSDGITQAGMGRVYPLGIGHDGIVTYTNKLLNEGCLISNLPSKIVNKAYEISGNKYEDDTSIAVLKCRSSSIINILTGPPVSKNQDKQIVDRFLSLEGKKVVCGSSTADMVARMTNKKVNITKMPTFLAESPSYSIEGMDIVTEGAITLNQLYNLLLESQSDFDSTSCVVDIYKLILKSDLVRFYVGKSINISHETLAFKQLGILSRRRVVKNIEEKLNRIGKIVVIEYI
ncbi:MAG: SpoIIE family protein phosphatase [Clostridiales bacterium]